MYIDTDAVEQSNRDRLQGWWDTIGAAAEYPVDTGTVCRLLQAAEYLADADTALSYVDQGIIPPPSGENGRHTWTATAVVQLACALEARRRWQPFSQIHSHKFSQIEKIRHICEHRGESAFKDLAQFDIEGLLGFIVSCSADPGAVQVLVEAVREKLKQDGVL